MPTTHVVWDWNGTLLYDFMVVREALNSCLRQRGISGICKAEYRRRYVRPPRTFHEGLVGREFTDDEWIIEQSVFTQNYAANRRSARLAPDAVAALQFLDASGIRQSLLSMLEHNLLVKMVEENEIARYFLLIQGSRKGTAGSKRDSLLNHLSRLDLEPAEVTLIGDAVDDANSARQLGASCVLVAADSCHDRPTLEATHFTTCGTLLEAVKGLTLS